MALIRRADADLMAREAMVVDLGDLVRQGDRIRIKAKADAEALVVAAHAERERLITGAREEGFARGLAEGRDKGHEEGLEQALAQALNERKAALQTIERTWTDALASFTQERQAMLREARREVLMLALDIARRVVRKHIETDPTIAEAQLEAILACASRPTRLVIRVSPLDAEMLTKALPELLARFPFAEHVELVKDPTMPQGGCIARSAAGGWFDTRIDTQLDRICDAIMPGQTQSITPVVSSPATPTTSSTTTPTITHVTTTPAKRSTPE